ncbi:MAG: hypothetical protein KDD58_05040 [Bdellovibrionales bacterium]|nr:hypothetical protein [Bdellovibrionales bacterium]
MNLVKITFLFAFCFTASVNSFAFWEKNNPPEVTAEKIDTQNDTSTEISTWTSIEYLLLKGEKLFYSFVFAMEPGCTSEECSFFQKSKDVFKAIGIDLVKLSAIYATYKGSSLLVKGAEAVTSDSFKNAAVLTALTLTGGVLAVEAGDYVEALRHLNHEQKTSILNSIQAEIDTLEGIVSEEDLQAAENVFPGAKDLNQRLDELIVGE